MNLREILSLDFLEIEDKGIENEENWLRIYLSFIPSNYKCIKGFIEHLKGELLDLPVLGLTKVNCIVYYHPSNFDSSSEPDHLDIYAPNKSIEEVYKILKQNWGAVQEYLVPSLPFPEDSIVTKWKT